MSEGSTPGLADADDEVAALIATLHGAEQRLEALTAGEVDAVADHDGHTFMLRRAQDQLRKRVAAKQAAILDALPAHIALIDARGGIVAVNESWVRFAAENGGALATCGVGANYLDVCDAGSSYAGAGPAAASESFEVAAAAAGIRSVLSGANKRYTLEYPCHSATEERWFMLLASPLVGAAVEGAVIMHLDMTAAKQNQEGVRASDLRFRQMAESMRDVFFLQSLDGTQVLYVSPSYEQIWGRTCESLYADSTSWSKAIHPDDAALEGQTPGADPGTPSDHEFRIVRPDGEARWIHVREFDVLDAAGVPYRRAGVASDVTDRKGAENRIAQLNRVLSISSAVNSLIVRVRGRDELFREACRIAVSDGGFRMAWIGVVDSGMRITPVASSGTGADFLTELAGRFLLIEGAPLGNSMTAVAIREKRPVVSNDSQHDPQALMGKRHAEAGVRSLAVLPLVVADQAVGVLALYAGESQYFHAAEMKLLTELAGNIAFAIDHIDKREQLDYLAYYDVLTGLANRGLFLERVTQYIRAAASGGHKLAVYLIDLERFKNVNDSLGRLAGDALLRQVAEWFRKVIADTNLLARVGADRFAVVLPVVRHESDVARLLEKRLGTFLAHSFRLQDTAYRIGAKVGVALYPDDGADADSLFRNAEAALKKAQAGGDRYLFYAQQMTERVSGRLSLETRLRQAVDNQEFVLHYQPKINLRTGALTGAEALIRWNDPHSGLVPPGEFIPVLEETGLIREVGRWALGQAVATHVRWQAAGWPAVPIAVNVSPLQLRNRAFIDEIAHAIGSGGNLAARIELEITESMVMVDMKESIASLAAIRAMGVQIAIDDFGTGFSSLSLLAKLPVDTLKIDRSFISEMSTAPKGLALVSTIISLAHSLKLRVVAEGVETDDQARLLRLLDCDEMQGFVFSRPVPVEAFEASYLVGRHPLRAGESPTDHRRSPEPPGATAVPLAQPG